MRKYLLILTFLTTMSLSNAQDIDLKLFDYSKADSIALSFDRKKIDAENLAYFLTEDLETEHEKFRVLFRWVTDKIAYSYAQNSIATKEVLQERTAVCSGYSNLLEVLCSYVDIKCPSISGYSKVIEANDIGTNTESDHAWNAVKLHGKWYLVDVTWASGYVFGRNFTKEFDEYYYLTNPDHFIYRHYPLDSNWTKTSTQMSLKEFCDMPIYKDDYFILGIQDLNKVDGLVKKRLQYQFQMQGLVRNISYYLEANKKFHTIDFIKEGNKYSIDIEFNNYQKGELLLYVNRACVMGFMLQ